MLDEELRFKIVLVGDSSVGKTGLAIRYVQNQFDQTYKATIGIEILQKTIRKKDCLITLQIWDTAGQQKFRSINKNYYKGALGVLFVYDVTNAKSYLNIQYWLKNINQNLKLEQLVLFIVGNKIDLQKEQVVTYDRVVNQYKNKFDIQCWQVSAKTGKNVQEMFDSFIQKLFKMNIQEILQSVQQQIEQNQILKDQNIGQNKKNNPYASNQSEDLKKNLILNKRRSNQASNKRKKMFGCC